jgi:predicted O-methyltransferase YrrM
VGGVDPGFDSVWRIISPIEGWLSREQAAVLFAAARRVQPRYWIVEIGSWHGRSTVVLAKGKRDSAHLLAIDPFEDPPYGGGDQAYDEFCRQIRRAEVDSDVQLFRGASEEAAESHRLLFDIASVSAGASDLTRGEPTSELTGGERVQLLFVDGAHDRNSVLTDIDRWEPLVAEGGLVCFHDAFFRIGVTLALLQRHSMDTRFLYLGSVGSLAVFRRERQISAADALASTLALMKRLGYFSRNMLVTAALRGNCDPLLRLFPPEESCEYR